MKKCLLAIITLSGFYNLSFAATTETTSINIIHPTIPNSTPVAGDCWTSSIASPRNDAWRCMVGNAIHDPCFATTNNKIVVCYDNPSDAQSSIAISLTKPLPNNNSAQKYLPIFLKLADGSTCTPFTGTLSMVNKMIVSYGCSDSKPCDSNGCQYLTGLTGKPQKGRTWWVQKVSYAVNKGKSTLIRYEKVAVASVWQ